MKVIWKYKLPIEDEFSIEMPKRAEILAIHNQGGIGCMWVLVSENAPMKVRTFRTVGTGHPIKIDTTTKYRGTYMERQFVWHIFEEITP